MKQILTLLILIACANLQAQDRKHANANEMPGFNSRSMPLREHNLLLRQANDAQPTHRLAGKTTLSGPVFDTSRWARRIDSTWGVGIPASQKLELFNRFWGQTDSFYSCFIHLPMYNWDSIVADIDTQIVHGVSKGRFAALANSFMTLINDGHSNFRDYTVNYGPYVYPGLPVFRGESGRFGACVTTYHDSFAMVYNAHPGHPFGLQPGDIILGYNDVPWTDLVRIILKFPLPNSVYKGSTDIATMHRYIQAAGENWYLFDSINILKCDGRRINLPTSLMVGHSYNDFCTEQLPVAGTHILTEYQYYTAGLSISAGVVEGKKIGYIYMYDCSDATGMELLNATKTLVEDSMVNGLIYDIRTNFGGGFLAFWRTFEYLHSGDVSWVGYGDRFDMNRYNLFNYGLSTWYDVIDTDAHYFTHPIGIIAGPNAVSAGDFFPIMFKHDAGVKLFGQSTAGAYGSYHDIAMPYPGYGAARQDVNFFCVEDPLYYITHTAYPVDVREWLDKDSVCAGVDNLAGDVIRWIEHKLSTNSVVRGNTIKLFPNPAKDYLNITISASTPGNIGVRLCNILGSVVKELVFDNAVGDNTLKVSLDNLPKGVYIAHISGDGNQQNFKIIKE